jgi:hypothetical protein
VRKKEAATNFGAVLLLGFLLWPSSVFAYRPFDSTDPAVADLGEIEVEFSPVSFRHQDQGETWIAPAARLNYGFARDWEVVLEGQAEHSSFGRSALVDNELSLKTVLQEGSLQDKSGLSLASEVSLLLPGLNRDAGSGVTLAGIAGERWDWGTVHVNVAGTLTRDQRGAIFFGTIIEGPHDWKVRPVAEFVYDREFGAREEEALLAGLIWQASDKLAFDLGLRQAQIDSKPETEVRMGLTFAFPAG